MSVKTQLYSCVLTDILYEFVYLVLRYTTGMALLKILESSFRYRMFKLWMNTLRPKYVGAIIKGKAKGNHRTGHEGPDGE